MPKSMPTSRLVAGIRTQRAAIDRAPVAAVTRRLPSSSRPRGTRTHNPRIKGRTYPSHPPPPSRSTSHTNTPTSSLNHHRSPRVRRHKPCHAARDRLLTKSEMGRSSRARIA
jgi:hypothetical protein